MASIDPTRAQFQTFMGRDLSRPLAMLNLLRFRAQAAYERDSGEPERTGAQAYGIYLRATEPIAAHYGAKPLVSSAAADPLIAPPGENWDLVLIVSYPSGQAFVDMIQSADYRAIVHHRTAAVADSRLIPMFGTKFAPDA